MNIERRLALIYSVLGFGMGILSIYFASIISLIIGAGVYIVSFFAVKKFVRDNKKFSWYVLNTLVTFVLVWLVTWIFLFNL